jgi:hypothetical protein
VAISCLLAGVVACGAEPGSGSGPDTAPVAASDAPGGAGEPSESPTSAAPTEPAPTASTVAPAATPAGTRKTVTVTKKIPFRTKTVEDDSLADGKVKIRTKGVAGEQKLTYRVTLVDGVEQGRTLIRRETVRKPTTRVKVVGTGSAGPGGSCHPNYGGCVPIASDVDCAGGSGNGPEYVSGPVSVKGDDVYDLDADGDGTACDS